MQTVSFLNNLAFDVKPIITKMLETNQTKEIRICMGKESQMQEHKAPGAITIMVLFGEVSIDSQGENILLKDGDMVYFDANVPHSLEAKKESVVRLVLSKNDSFARVENLIKFK